MVVIAIPLKGLNRLNDPARVHVEGRVPGTNLIKIRWFLFRCAAPHL
jgi:hypothetical protein